MTERRARIAGVDAARAMALVGMFATHVLPLSNDDGTATATELIASGRSSALFAVLAGVGIALSTGGPRGLSGGRAHADAAAGLVVRAVLIGLLGMVLVGLDPPVAVILTYYALLFVVAIPVLRLPPLVLAIGAAIVCAGAPVLSHLLRIDPPEGLSSQPGLDSLARPAELLTTLSLTGVYPVLPWTAYLLAGLAVGRLDLRRRGVAIGLLGGGAALAVAAWIVSAQLLARGGAAAIGPDLLPYQAYGTTPTDTWWWLAIAAPHSGTPFDLAHTIGTALAVLGLMLLLERWVAGLVWLPAAVGAIPLTLYTTHVVVVATASLDDRFAFWLANVLGAVLIGVVVRLAGVRGPLEAMVSAASHLARRVVTGAPTGSRA